MKPDPLLALILLLCSTTIGVARCVAQEVPRNHFYPQEAFLVPVADRVNLQARLDQYGVIRLEPGDYGTRNTLTKLIVRSGNRIYGLGNTVPPMEVEPGTTGAVLSAVNGQLLFPASNTVTALNLFRHIDFSSIIVNGGTLERNLFLNTSYSSINIDHSVSGYWNRNRIIRFINQSTTTMLTIRGRAESRANCHGNVFAWMNSLGAASSQILSIADQSDLNIVYIDCEPFESVGTAMTFRGIDDLSVFATSGLMPSGRTIDNGATSFWLHGHQMSTLIAPNTIQRAANTTSVITHFNPDMGTPSNEASAASRFRLFDTTSEAAKFARLNEAPLVTPLSAGQEYSLMRAVNLPRTDPTWERPSFDPVPDPAGPSWNADLASKSSSRAAIQNDIDTHGIAVLGPGIYYLDGPLVLGDRKGLVGAGIDRTVLIALNPGIDLITSRRVNSQGTEAISITLADVTLQGGRSGIHHSISGSQFLGMIISHVTIRDMADSGIWLENIFGWDNNAIDFLNILNCPSGIKQRAPAGSFTSSDPSLTYLDKNVFYQCQFLGCQNAIDFTGNRPSNGNMWMNCRFADNTGCAARMQSHYSPVFANCDFSNNGGHPVVYAQGLLNLVGCAFDDSTSGATDYVDSTNLSLEGCTFSRHGSSNVVITAFNSVLFDHANPDNDRHYHNRNTYFFNCASSNVPLDQLYSGLVVNSSFFDRADLSVQAAMVTGSGATVTPLVAGAVDPTTIRSQLLVGAVFPGALTAETLDAPPALTSPAVVNDATVGNPFAYAITADHFPTSYSASGLPAWLTLEAVSGILTGTPPAAGAFSFSVTASNIVGADTQTVTLNVAAAGTNTPVITSAISLTAFLDTPFSFQVIASPSPTGYNAAALPGGLSIDTSTGLISGTPSQLGTRVSSISATNANGVTITCLAFTVLPKVLTRPVPPGTASASSSSGGGGGGCGFGATAAALMCAALLTRLRRPRANA